MGCLTGCHPPFLLGVAVVRLSVDDLSGNGLAFGGTYSVRDL